MMDASNFLLVIACILYFPFNGLSGWNDIYTTI
jgi:hypothetical protein